MDSHLGAPKEAFKLKRKTIAEYDSIQKIEGTKLYERTEIEI